MDRERDIDLRACGSHAMGLSTPLVFGGLIEMVLLEILTFPPRGS